ncbi:ParB/RepB/Spo0J family partition protein [Lachnospiraceae bacterium]|nr:ParB/RepB/Spo0J family partition protein [Lachnospiraceae bacterium]
MPIKRNGLGKGLDSLIPDKNVKPEAEAKVSVEKSLKNKNPKTEKTDSENTHENPTGELMLNINEVEPNRGQPRKEFDEDALLELADSVRQYGILQPLIVQKNKGYYEIIAGERRWRAAKLAGLKEVPVIIKEYTSQQVVEISLIENIQRENLNPIEEAMAFKRLLDEFNLKQDEVAERVSKSRTAVTNSMRLLKLDDKVQQMIIDDMISTGHARALLAIDNKEQQYSIATKIFDEKLSVRETEKLVKSLKNPKKKVEKEKIEHVFVYDDLIDKMKNVMGTKVNINAKANGKGKIEIEYYSEEELERIYDLIMTISQ